MVSVWQSTLSKIPYKVLFLWIVIVIIGYYFTIPSLPSDLSARDPKQIDYFHYANQVQSAFVTSKIKDYFPQAIVFVSMGNLSQESLVEDSITSVRSIGHWTEKIYILTDKPNCFESFTLNPNTFVIKIPPKKSILDIKRIKAQIFSYLPSSIDRVLYMDVDIIVARSMGSFLQDLSHLLYLHHYSQLYPRHSKELLTLSKNVSTASMKLDFAAFLDSKGHYVGFCAGCEKWHTGVIYTTRQSSAHCMAAWANVLARGLFPTDQQSLDFVETNGSCANSLAIPSRHLLFAKDYIAMLLTSGHTFIHLTSANRIGESDYFYREMVLPRMRNSFHPPLKPYSANERKQC